MIRLAGVVVVLVALAGVATAEDGPSCTTVVVATDCDRNPVPGLKVKVVTERGWTVKAETDGEGRAEFELCVEDIAKLRVGGVRADRVPTGTVIEETETTRLATITVPVCDA